MNTPRPKVAPLTSPAFADVLGEQPLVGTMNYARKYPNGATGGYAAPGMPISVGRASYLAPKAKKEPLSLATYKKGVKSVSTPTARTTDTIANPNSPTPTYPVATSPFSEVDSGDPDLADNSLAPSGEQPQAIRSQTLDVPTRDSGIRTPKDYKEAATLIKGDKGLYSQYKAGIASGKAFSLSVGGKTFKYAATPKQAASPTPKKTMKAAGSEERAEDLQGTGMPEVNLPVAPTLGQNISIQYDKQPKKMSGKKK